MKTYLSLLEEILRNGKRKGTEHGIETIGCHGLVFRHDVRDGWPLLTTKTINYKHQVAELLWYLSGESHIRNLRKHAGYWGAWADDEGHLQSAYGRFWRRFPTPEPLDFAGRCDIENGTVNVSPYENDEVWVHHNNPFSDWDEDVHGPVVDQFALAIHALEKDINTRRAVVSAWHPGNAYFSKLPPCHVMFRFGFDGEALTLTAYQRSADMPLGAPYNIAQYSLLLMLVANSLGVPAGSYVHLFDDAHIYVNQLDGVYEQIKREPKPLPQIIVPDKHVLDLGWDDVDDFALVNYDPHPPVKFPITEVGVHKYNKQGEKI